MRRSGWSAQASEWSLISIPFDSYDAAFNSNFHAERNQIGRNPLKGRECLPTLPKLLSTGKLIEDGEPQATRHSS